MITRISEIIHKWTGWCPNARTMRTAPPVIATPPVTIHPAQPDGGAGGSGRIDRGIRLAIGSIRILIRNRQLLWFSFLTGLVVMFSLITTFALQFFSGTDPFTGRSFVTEPQTVLVAKGSLAWLTATYASQLIGAFCTFFLLAGLITCVSFLLSGRTATIREGLSYARRHLRPVAGWALVFAIAGTAQSVLMNLYPGDLFLMFISGIMVFFLYLVTLFVIPALIFEEKSLLGAITRSLSLFRQTWGEILVCCFFFCLLFFAVAFVSILPMVSIGFPSGDPVLLGVTVALYILVLAILIMISWAVIGILLVGLYTYAKTGRIPGMFEEKQGVKAPV